MEGKKKPFKPFPRKRSNPQFKKKGGNKKGKWNSSSHEQQSSGNSNAPETIYRILCESKRIGSVIGKGGGIVKALRDETRSKITVAESVPGSEERVIIIYSNSTKAAQKNNDDDNEEDLDKENDDVMEPHCAAQDALMKVHERIIEEDLVDGPGDEDNNDIVITARLLVPNNMVGCVLGKKGDVIQRLRSETGASIRVLPSDHLPTCAMSTDELVQISGNPAVAKRALYEVSTLLHKNPRKDQPVPSFPMPYGAPTFRPPGPPMPNMIPPGDPMWSHRNPNSHGIPPMPWTGGGYRNEPSGIGPGGFNGVPPPHGAESTSEFFMKILCSPLKIGGVIGKGGSNVRQLQQETGASIHAEDVTAESDERVIRVSAFEDPRNPRSQTIDAILQLQNLTGGLSDKGVITTRLLVPSSKVGCLIGQGGHLINEMRRRTRADIRVFSKEEKPKFATADDELVQISGSFGVAKEALGEIASRLRDRCLRDAKGGPEQGPVGPVPGFGRPGGRTPPFGSIRAGTSGGYGNFKGPGREYEPPSYPVPPSATGYPNFNRDIEIPSNALGPVRGSGGSHTGDFGGTRVMLQDRHTGGGSECVVEIRGSSQHLNNAYQAYMASGAPTSNPQHDPYQNYNTPTPIQPGAYSNINPSQTAPYQSSNPPQDPYYNHQNIGGTHQQPPPYETAQGSYPHNYSL